MPHYEYSEAREHTTEGFPLAYYLASRDAIYSPKLFHCHREFEFGRILTGSLDYYIGNTIYHLEEGNCYFVRPGILHGCRKEDCDFESVVFDFDTLINSPNSKVLENIKKVAEQTPIPPLITPEKNSDICRIIETIISFCRNDISDHILSIVGNLYLFFGWINEHDLCETENNEISSTEEARLKRVLDYIDQNYDTPVTLSNLADCAGMSPCYFTSFFKRILHRPPIDYLNFYRVEKACALLLNSNHSITDIAYKTGFNSSSYFDKTFKKYKGISPKQYQQEVKKTRNK